MKKCSAPSPFCKCPKCFDAKHRAVAVVSSDLVRPLLRGYCIVAFVAVHVLHFPVFAIYWLGHLAEWIMEHVTCRAGDHIRKVWRYAGRPNDKTVATCATGDTNEAKDS